MAIIDTSEYYRHTFKIVGDGVSVAQKLNCIVQKDTLWGVEFCEKAEWTGSGVLCG